MAEEPTQQNDEQAEPTPDVAPKRFVWLAIAVVVALVCAGAGFGIGSLLAASHQTGAASGEQQTGQEGAMTPAASPHEDYEYYEFRPVAVNLSEPRMDRHIRVTIKLAIESHHFQEAQEILDRKKPELESWLTVFLSGCTLEDVRGTEKLNRLGRRIQDELNEQLWPDTQPLIDRVLFNEFVVQ